MRAATSFLVLALACALTAGCGGKTPPSHFYRLAPPGASEQARQAPPTPEGIRRLEVGIPAFHVDPPYDQDQLVYRVGRRSQEVGFRSRERWAAPLSRLLPALLADHLMEVAGGFVSAGPPAGRPLDAQIIGHVKALEEIATPEGAVALFRVELTLRGRDGASIWGRTLEAEAPVEGGEVADAVRAMDAAVLEAFGQARAALSGALLGLARSTEGPGTTSPAP